MTFQLGQLVATPGALKAFQQTGQVPFEFLNRHLVGDWGDCDDQDARANDNALTRGGRIFSVYHLKDGTKIWIITEADRSSTCVLLPSEY
jgi:hypothetical protein